MVIFWSEKGLLEFGEQGGIPTSFPGRYHIRHSYHEKKSFSYSGAQLWNSLPIELWQATSLNDFKAKLRHHSYK